MSARPMPFRCARTDAMLALLLDGDVGDVPVAGGSSADDGSADDGYAFVCGDTLHAHLHDCEHCQSALRRARRLDAALAQAAGRRAAEQDDEAAMRALEQRWFTAVQTAALPTAGLQRIGVPRSASLREAAPRGAQSSTAQLALPRAPRTPHPARTAWLWFAAAAGVIVAVTVAMLQPVPARSEPAERRLVATLPVVTLMPHDAVVGEQVGEPVGEQVGEPVGEQVGEPVGEQVGEPGVGTELAQPMAGDAATTDSPYFTPASIQRLQQDRRTAAVDPWRSLSARELQRLCENRGKDPACRMHAADLLVEAGRGNTADAAAAREVWINLLASCSNRTIADGMLHASWLDRTRCAPHLLAELRARLVHVEDGRWEEGRAELESARLDDSFAGVSPIDGKLQPHGVASGGEAALRCSPTTATLLVAARIGDRDLDAQLRRVCRRQPAAAEILVAAMRCGQRPRGAGQLLLDLWQDLGARFQGAPGHGDDADVAARWFPGQPATVFAEVLDTLRRSRSTPQRQRCLLALGHAADDSTLTTLLQSMASAHRSEAFAAAFALSNLPHEVLDGLLATAADSDAWLLRAALARAGLPAARPWLDALLLRPDELIRFGRASLADFPEVASWFRDRCAQLGD